MRLPSLAWPLPALLALLLAAPAAAAPRAGTSTASGAASGAPGDADGDEAEGAEPGAPRARSPEREAPRYRHERGSFAVSLLFGASKDDAGWRYAGGLGLGYAVLTGVVPGVRGLLSSSSGGLGGEYAATLTLTPPISLYAVPFAVGELGRRHDPSDQAWTYGAGLGLYLGHPAESGSALQLGWMWRRLDWSSGRRWDVQGPVVSLVWDH